MTKRNTLSSPEDSAPSNDLRRYLDRFERRMQVQHFAPGTIALRRKSLERFLTWCDERGITTLSEITRDVIASYQRSLYHYRQPKSGLPLRFTYQVSLLLPIRAWFRDLVKEKITDINPALDLELPRETQRLPKNILTVEEVEAIINVPDVTAVLGLRDRAMLETSNPNREQPDPP